MLLTAITKYGPVEGFEDNGIRRWSGIPFAAPPVGDMRFRRAREPEPWTKVLPCRDIRSSVQFAAGPMAERMVLSAPESEDCLLLNVWAPEHADGAPVFVYIYGGANHMGESASPNHDLGAFAREGIVGVSFNYRLGALGFYDFSGLGPGFDSNCAVSDMILALRWVHENISSFGGDPGNVTICGESAGGTGVYCMLAAPSARGYFRRAIPMSGLAGNVTPRYVHELNNALFFEELGLTPRDAAAALKAMSVKDLVRGGGAVMEKHNDAHQGIFLTGPVIDDLIPDYPWRMLAKGSAAGVELLVGTCRDEGGLFCMLGNVPTSWDKIETCLRLGGGEDRLDAFRRVYGHMPEREAAIAWDTDRMFWVDAQRCATAQCGKGRVYSYRFDFVPTMCAQMGIGATHSMDIGPGLDTYDPSPMSFYYGTPMEQQRDIHAKLHGAFSAFVRTGDPNNDAVGAYWEPYTADTRAAMSIDSSCAMLTDPNHERLEAWGDLVLYDRRP
ncbi:MAG: carboxylesterase/lipase family protein [Oscillospiraceae bacterium]|nr:carboxylesterase/lipase family protein [Oscillospiraceae bacterium]